MERNAKEKKRAFAAGIVKRTAALFAALMILLSVFGCVRKPVIDPDAVVDVTASERPDPTARPTEIPTEIPSAEPTEAPTQIPTETPSEEPTATPKPTKTPKPTNTPKPTKTPKPTSTPEATPDGKVRRIYLTFDDGPNKNTPEVLDILKKYGIKATFFTVGSCIKANPETTRRIVEEGHLLACHTYSHDFSVIYQDPEHFAKDVAKWRALVTDVVGYDAGAYVYRFPGGSTNTTIGGRKGRGPYVEKMNEEGYIAMDWNLALNDAWLAGNKDHLPVEEYFWKTYQQTWSIYKNKEPLIFIIHDTKPASVKLLSRIIEDLIAKGCEFGLCDELTEDYLM